MFRVLLRQRGTLLAAILLPIILVLYVSICGLPIGISVPIAAVRYYADIENQSNFQLYVTVSHINDVEHKVFGALGSASRDLRGWSRRRECVLLPGERWRAALMSENETQKGVVQITACTDLLESDPQRCLIYFAPWRRASYSGVDSENGGFPLFVIREDDLKPVDLSEVKTVFLED